MTVMSVDELERLTGAALDREIRNLRDLGLWEDAAGLEAVRDAFVAAVGESHSAAAVGGNAPHIVLVIEQHGPIAGVPAEPRRHEQDGRPDALAAAVSRNFDAFLGPTVSRPMA